MLVSGMSRVCILAVVLFVACQPSQPGPGTPDAGPDAGQPPPRTVETVKVAGPESVLVGEGVQLSATVLDQEGKPFEGIRVDWRSGDATIADVDREGWLTGVSPGSTFVEAFVSGKTGRLLVTVNPRPVGSVEVFPVSFSLTVEDQRQLTAVVRDDTGAVVRGLPVTWKRAQLGTGDTVNARRPVEVGGGLRFRSVQAGWRHSCGVTLESRGYCWGSGEAGRLGNGSFLVERAFAPTAVTGNLSFDSISSDTHTCGRSQAGAPIAGAATARDRSAMGRSRIRAHPPP